MKTQEKLTEEPLSPVPTRTYKLDLNWILRRCAGLDIDFDILAIRAGLAETPRDRVSGQTLVKLAKVLGCLPEDCTVGWIVPGWRVMEDVRRSGSTDEDRRAEKADRDKLRRAHRADMKGRHDAAVSHCQELLERLDPVQDPELCARVRVRMVDFLDNGGRLEEALEEVDALLTDLRRLDLGPDGQELEIWAELSKGRVLHRRHDFADARDVLEGIRHGQGNPYRISAGHQLGVAALEEYLAPPALDEARRAELLDTAQQHFVETIEEWSGLNFTYREGFSHRRLAQVHRIRGEYRQSIDHYVEAVDGFASFACRRYLDATRAELDETLDEQALKLHEALDEALAAKAESEQKVPDLKLEIARQQRTIAELRQTIAEQEKTIASQARATEARGGTASARA